MSQMFQLALIILLLNDLALLACNRLPTMVKMIVVQGVLISLLLILANKNPSVETFVLAGAIFAIKGLLLPVLLTHTRRHTWHDPQLRPYLGHGFSVIVGLLGIVFSLWLERHLPVEPGLFPALLIPAALTTLFCGFTLVVCRSRALAQIIGYLVAENGIFLFGIPLMEHGGVSFELALLLDVFAAVLVMGVAMTHINDSFDTTNSDFFCNLHD